MVEQLQETNGTDLDNRYVVPHNSYLLLKYRVHINVDWCNQSRSIKYIFKYVNKRKYRVTVEFYKSSAKDQSGRVVDEINMDYNCRYISLCEAIWYLFGFDIQFTTSAMEHLSFHFQNKKNIIFGDDDTVDDIINRPNVAHNMFLACFEANKKYPNARQLTYAKIPTKFVWKKKNLREWHPKQRFCNLPNIICATRNM